MRTVDELRNALNSSEQAPPPLDRFLSRIPGLVPGATATAVVDDLHILETMLVDVDPSATGAAASGATAAARSRAATWFLARRRRVVAALTAVVFAGVGMGVAAAAGVSIVPTAVLSLFELDHDPGAFNPDASTAKLLFTIPGPTGQPLHLWYTDASHRGYCTYLLEAPDSAPTPGRPTPLPAPLLPSAAATAHESQPAKVLAGGCSGVVGDAYWRRFGAGFGAGFGYSSGCRACPDDVASFIVHVPGAARVRLVFDDGTSHPMPLADAWTAGWITHHQAAHHPTLVGYDAIGAEVGRYVVPR